MLFRSHEIGRVIQAVEDLGQLDNTLIIYIGGDNGASAEGMLNGTPNEFTTFNGVEVPVKAQYLWYPFWGSDAGEYYRIAQDLLAGGHVSVAYSGWGATYPWFPGMFFVVDGLAFAGADLPAALNLGIPALGAFLVVPIFLVVGPRLRDDREIGRAHV